MAASDDDNENDDADHLVRLKDRPFNPWRIPLSPNVASIVDEAVRMLENYEGYYSKRKRKRRPADQDTFVATVAAILCDLMHYHLNGKTNGIFITRSNQVLGKKSRYRPDALGKTLPNILDMMQSPEMGFLVQDLGSNGDFGTTKRTTIKPSQRLVDRIVEHGVSLEDLGVSDLQEVIVLRRTKEDYWDQGAVIEYDDTAQTNAMRDEIRSINAWLVAADISFDDSVLDDEAKSVDIRDRSLRRIFTQGRFDSGGRLFGGFWQGLGKQQRRNGLIIDGEETVELDYGQMNPRIVYGLSMVQPVSTDLYSIPGYNEHRTGIKKVMNAMLFSDKPLTRMPKGVRGEFSKNHSMKEVAESILNAHDLIADKFYTGIGHQAQCMESNILVDALLVLKDSGMVGLPVHDSILIPKSSSHEGKAIMLSSFYKYTGIEGMVSEVGRVGITR